MVKKEVVRIEDDKCQELSWQTAAAPPVQIHINSIYPLALDQPLGWERRLKCQGSSPEGAESSSGKTSVTLSEGNLT